MIQGHGIALKGGSSRIALSKLKCNSYPPPPILQFKEGAMYLYTYVCCFGTDQI